MPGAYKLIVFSSIQHFHSTASLGTIATWFSIAQIICFLTSIGWATLILTRIPKTDPEKKIGEFNSILLMSILTLIPFIIIISLIGYLFNKTEITNQINLWLAAWTLYQIPRHYCIAARSKIHAIVCDATIIIISAILIHLTPTTSLSLALSTTIILCSITLTLSLQEKIKLPKLEIGYDTKGLQFGLTNLLSGGFGLCLVPLANFFEGEDFAGMISIYLALTALILLIPRALSISYLPRVSALINTHNIADILIEMRKRIFVSNLAAAVLSVVIVLSTIVLQAPKNPISVAIGLTLLTLLNFTTNQILASTNILIAQESSKFMMELNLIIFSLFTGAALLLISLNVPEGFNIICTIYLALNITRLIIFNKKTAMYYASNRTL